jgi:hypothetical protein
VRALPKRKPAVSSKGVQLNTFQKRDCKSRFRTEHDSFSQYAELDVRCSSQFRTKGRISTQAAPGGKKSVPLLRNPFLGVAPFN